MTPRQIRGMFQGTNLLYKHQAALMDTNDGLHQHVQQYMLDLLSDTQQQCFYHDLWFGSYASSVMDARRVHMFHLEITNSHGFEMYFKISRLDVLDDEDLDELEIYPDHEGLMLYHHSTCHFLDNKGFAMDMGNDEDNAHIPTDLKWRWIEEGMLLQVGPYPPLSVSRRKDWGWKLENAHVVLVYRDARGCSV